MDAKNGQEDFTTEDTKITEKEKVRIQRGNESTVFLNKSSAFFLLCLLSVTSVSSVVP
jgi:hypothetical protein